MSQRLAIDPAACTVVVTVDADADAMPDLVEHATMGLRAFASCPGYLGGALHRSDDGTRLIQYVQWTDAAAYERCRDDPRWDELASTGRFMAHVAARRATVDARVYQVIDQSPTA